MKVALSLIMFALGAVVGSFLACQAWRLRYKDTGKEKLGKRSVCLSCKKQLKWFDNLPVVSWLMLGGRCRYCGKKIGSMEILAEVLMGLVFFGLTWMLYPAGTEVISYVILGLVFLLMVAMGFLSIYDGKWGELPSFALIIALVLAAIICGLKLWLTGFSWPVVGDLLGAVAVLGGTYLILYLVSHGEWVGNGDWILGVIIGLVLGRSWLALIVLCLSNCLGLIVMYPAARKKKQKKIYFGPFLAIAFAIVLMFAEKLMLK
ncbi:prepilin peptidase [Candidatus Saccharibacteria bacterium]|nr:prepilin peptidase [Candidatus Saccharibacteria bacterium]